MRLLLSFLFLNPCFSYAGSFKVRAREHFDIHQIERNGVSETYTGLSNTINLWYEKPFDISYGLSVNPLIGSATKDNSQLSELGGRVRFIHIGGEVKKFFYAEGLFSRLGLGWTQLRSDGVLEISNGYNVYAGLGWEFKISNVGLAIEAAYRWSELQNNVRAGSFTPSVGVHFYELF